jgi:predicted ribosomally synthesized peptide with SipW-like signal peptide
MNRKILVSLSVIGVAAAIVVGGTIAYFSDTETSEGNTFTAGAIDLQIDNESYVTDETGTLVESTETSWELKDLEEGDLFFDFSDLKPGDIGEDTISLHVNSNDAWACMSIALTGTPEYGQTEPEAEVDLTTGDQDGELQDELYFAFWADDGDNVYETDEVIFAEGLAADLFDGTRWALADSTKNVWGDSGALQGGSDREQVPYVYYVGKVWCYGALEKTPADEGDSNPVDRGTTGFTCNGEPVSNASQTDGIEATVEFYAEQSRNNDDFVCAQPETTTVQSSVFNFSGTGWAGWSCPSSHPNIVSADTSDCTEDLQVSKAANSSDSDYPTYPHYTYNQANGEEGWVVQNGGTGQSCYIVLTCQAD